MELASKTQGQAPGKVGGQTTKENGEIISINPANENVIAKVFNCSQQDYEHVINSAQTAFDTWRMLPAPKRGDIIRQIGERLRQQKDALGSLVSFEMGKSKQEGDGEVQEMIDMAELAVGQSRMLYGKTMQSERPQHRMYEQWQPLGLVGVISAFNFPVAVWSWNAFIAAICGNCVVWRPSPKTPLCAIAVQHICNAVMTENNLEGIFSLIISDDVKLSEQFVNDARLPLISFTGSSRVGKIVSANVAQRMGRCLLECSGNNAIIVDKSADLKLALPAIVFGAVGTAGQRCTTTRRLFIHQDIFDTTVASLIEAYQQVSVGNPLDTTKLMGPLIDQSAVDDFNAAITAAKAAGGRVLTGGNAVTGAGFYVQPTIIQAEPHWDIVQQETFAPILYVMPYRTLDQAIELQNQVSQGLSSAIFTQNLKTAEQFLSAMGSDCGIANVNIGHLWRRNWRRHLVARRKRGVAVKQAQMRGKRICADKRARLIGVMNYRWHRELNLI